MAINLDRIAELAGLIRYHSDLYYNKTSEISDAEYDSLRDELVELVDEAKSASLAHTPEVSEAMEVLEAVGSVPSYGKKVTHPIPMGSLDKETETSKIDGWFHQYAKKSGKKIALTLKMDGCFRHDSRVMMANGEERAISEIRSGMSVLTMNEKTGVTEPKKVVSVLVRKPEESKWIRLVFDGGKEIVCTTDHLFLTSNRGWVEAKYLASDDVFVEPEL